ncbi:menaquinone biosynthetic enzyme MqnA/MqnD family protein [Nocardia aurantia]|uniref:Chorismate dehydratase n=1 Tax=Nocardia aurantia TaxID=2585199 RepID=A0A7K0DKP0_9NOCA|nr:menaquinone biosynthesis protein [Nocardia aurantia]MQY25792.1 Chorismate dehydratase [Nocardia aurantia]
MRSVSGPDVQAGRLTPLRRRPRVGHIEFLNWLPILWGLARSGSLVELDLVRGSPERLSAELAGGALDVGPISLVEFLTHADDLVMLPDLAIGCDGPVMSCLIVSRVPLDRLDGVPVALSSTSRTSVRLAQLLLAEHIGVRPRFFSSAPDLDVMFAQAPAAVLIGDVALRTALYYAPTRGLVVHDLGRMWRDWTGLPFVFAVVAARREFLEREPETVRQVHSALLNARDRAIAEMDELCERTARWEQFDAGTLRRYYTDALNFGLGPRQQQGIAEFAARTGFGVNVGATLLDSA